MSGDVMQEEQAAQAERTMRSLVSQREGGATPHPAWQGPSDRTFGSLSQTNADFGMLYFNVHNAEAQGGAE